MSILTTQVATLSKKPEFGSEEYKKWVEQDDFVQFLQTMPNLDEMVLYASAAHAFLYSVLVPARLVTPHLTPTISTGGAAIHSCPGASRSAVAVGQGCPYLRRSITPAQEPLTGESKSSSPEDSMDGRNSSRTSKSPHGSRTPSTCTMSRNGARTADSISTAT
jgi:hypothetical protein